MILKSTKKSFNGFAAIVLLALLSVLYGCSGNDNSTATTETKEQAAKASETTTNAPSDACTLLTEEEAKLLLGNAVTKGMSTATMCQYISASDELSKAGESVSIQMQYGAGSEFDAYVSNTEKDLNVKIKPVSGIGDKAVFAEGQLIVLKGKDFMIIIVGKKMNEEEQIAAEKAIAQKAIERLPAK